MALVAVTNVEVLDNPAPFSNPFQFEITFECHAPGIPDELEWKLIYVGSANDETLDQELDSVLVGPVSVGRNRFVFQAPAPDPTRIPNNDLKEVTVILITCSYREQEFVRIGYYVNNDYGDNQELNENPPELVDISRLYRNILANQPRLTRFQIRWSDEEPDLPAPALPANEYIEGEGEDDMGMELDDEDMDDEGDEEDDDDENFEEEDLVDEEQENRSQVMNQLPNGFNSTNDCQQGFPVPPATSAFTAH